MPKKEHVVTRLLAICHTQYGSTHTLNSYHGFIIANIITPPFAMMLFLHIAAADCSGLGIAR
jgi:hypothetical protein